MSPRALAMNEPSRPLRVLQLLAPAPVGGLERVVQGLTRGLATRGIEVLVGAVASDDDPVDGFAEPLRDAGIDVREIRVPHRAYLQERRRMAELCRDFRADVVHMHGYRPDVLARAPIQKQGIPVVSTVHGFVGLSLKNRLFEWLQVRSFRSFDAVVAVSQPIRSRLLGAGVPEQILRVVQNAPVLPDSVLNREEARRLLGLPEGARVAVWVGRMSREKAPDVLAGAAEHLHGVEVMFSFIGDGPARGEVEASMASLSADSRVSAMFHGPVADASRVLPAFDVFVLSSRTEGTPMVLFEAMSVDLPIVATRVGGVPDVLSEREALLVPSEDPVALAEAIRVTLTDEGAAHERALRAHERMDREFSTAAWIEEHVDLYREVSGWSDV